MKDKDIYNKLNDIVPLVIDEKYYQPDISEFYVGFEIECNVEKRWIKIKYMENFLQGYGNPNLLQTYNDLKRDCIRVKYLDQEDIENLGWIIKEEDQYWITFLKNSYCMTINKSYYTKITIHNGEQYEQHEQYFKGIIKNKSELKKIMTMLEIN